MADRPLEPSDLYDLRRVRTVAVSPDGERVAFVVSEADESEDAWHESLFVAPTDGSREPHRLTSRPGAGSPEWSPDGSKLAFVAARPADTELTTSGDEPATDGEDERAGSDDEPEPQVWAFDLERGGDARQLTDFEEGVESFDWGPAGERLVVAARDPTDDQREYLAARREDDAPIETERLQHKYDGKGWLDEVRTYLFVVDCESRETDRLDDAYGGGAQEPATGLQPRWSPDGGHVAFLSNRTDRPDDSGAMDAYTIAPDGSGLRRVTDGDLFVSDLAWSPGGDRIALAARAADNWYDTTEVLVADPDTGDASSVSESLDRTLSRAGMVRWVDDDTLLGPFADEGRTRLVRLRTDGEPERVFDRQNDSETVAGFDAAGGTAALVRTSPDETPDVYALPVSEVSTDGGSGALRRVSNLNDGLVAAVETPSSERVSFENGNGDDIEAIAYLPADFDPARPEERPLIVKIHGGPMAYDEPKFGFEETYWTGRGYAVLEVNYRGSTSYGRAFSEQIRGEWGPRETDDVVSGARALVDRGWADPDRLFVTGFSQGGINTLHVLTRTDDFAAAAPEHGIYDFYGLYGTADTHHWYESDLGLPWENPEGYRAISTIQDVGAVETPTLLTAGEDDWRCPPWQAEQLYVRLKKRDVPSKLVVYPDEHHNVGDPERTIHRLRTLTDWFETHDPAIDERA
ncbi:S9 family peptidase [Halorussus marinus]|uniref:S9 family peptidase n=1 Tax=Halorussus marinus TaxID=2505976 RepID=UPI00106E5CF3|nr:S9 family peptidase [Halorussus marinus]